MTALTAALIPTIDIPVGVGAQPTRDGTKPFIVIWPDAGMGAPRTMRRDEPAAVETWVCHCLGLTPESAAVAVRKLAAAVYALHRTVVGGRLVQWPEQLSAVPLTRDDDADPPLYDFVVEWRFTTSPTE